jgi:hypothetical protein
MNKLLKTMFGQAGSKADAGAARETPAEQTSSSMDALLATVRRIDADRNSFGIPVIDCREFATSLLADSAEPIPPETAFLPRDQRTAIPQGATSVACSLTYPLGDRPPEGPLFMARSMQDKWHIFYYGDRLIFTRSWTGDPLFVAECEHRGPMLNVRTVHAVPGSVDGGNDLTVAMVDFLIKSHLFRVAVPHPLPVELPDIPSLVATWSFNHFGRWGHFATWADVVRLRLVSMNEGLVLRWLR